ncbi:MAG: sulfurtransferase TusA family protein [Magnetovibrionaceae bacterium]
MTESQIDCSGLECPLPVLKATKAMKGLKAGDRLIIIATDPASAIDIPHFCNERGHTLESQSEAEGTYTYRLIKG